MIPDPLPIDSCPAAFSTAAGQGFSSCSQQHYAANGRLSFVALSDLSYSFARDRPEATSPSSLANEPRIGRQCGQESGHYHDLHH